jgi:hypothetical protein
MPPSQSDRSAFSAHATPPTAGSSQRERSALDALHGGRNLTFDAVAESMIDLDTPLVAW